MKKFQVMVNDSKINFDTHTPDQEIELAVKNRYVIKDTKDKHGNTLMHFAVATGKDELFSLLLQYSFSFNEPNNNDETPRTMLLKMLEQKKIQNTVLKQEALLLMKSMITHEESKKQRRTVICCWSFS